MEIEPNTQISHSAAIIGSSLWSILAISNTIRHITECSVTRLSHIPQQNAITLDHKDFSQPQETRLWRKTRSRHTVCDGADPNRNFDFYWMLVGASNDQCSEIYAGPRAFSESETRALRDYLLANQGQIKLYLTYHSYGRYLLYPWGYTSALPDNNDELYSLAVSVNEAIRSVAGTSYTIGTSTNALYAAAGGSDDYAKAVAGIELSYTIELPGGGLNGFDPPATRILSIAEESWEGVKAYHRYIESQFVNQ